MISVIIPEEALHIISYVLLTLFLIGVLLTVLITGLLIEEIFKK